MTQRKILTTAVPAALAAPALALSQAYGGTINFNEVPVPRDDATKRQIVASSSAVVDGKPVSIGYNTILRSGDPVGRGPDARVFGQLLDQDGRDLMAEDGSKVISNDNDFSSLLTGDFGRLYDVNRDRQIDILDETIASRLETRRWAAMEGGTTELRKMEGITFDPDRGRLYLAMSEIDRGMLDNMRVGKGEPGVL